MSVWATLAEGAIEVGKQAGFWKKIRRAIRRKKHILILGASGTGKTQFLHSLKDQNAAALDAAFQRTVSVEKRSVVLDEYPFLLIDTPGQQLDQSKRRKAIAEAFTRGIEGVVNVCCFGFHEASEAGSEAALPKSGRGIADAEYLETRRELEIDLLSEWVPLFGSASARWVLTVVTKADLWWPENDRVRRYYEEGKYGRATDELLAEKSVLPYCAVIEPFFKHKTSGVFGDQARAKLQAHLKESLIRMTGVVR